MRKVRVRDKEFQLSVGENEIRSAVKRIADSINKDYEGKNPLFMVILNGAFIFAADLFRNITIPCEISFVKYASYSGTSTTSEVRELIGLNEDIRNRNVIIVEDIVDTGVTMQYLLAKLKSMYPSEIKLAALFFKPDAFRANFSIDYLGMKIPNRFVVGYGLDYDGYGRNYPEVYSEVKDKL
jgi:hypoxanthine phosphoribosyltransferase